MGFLSAPSDFLAQRFRNFDSKILGLKILSMKNGRSSESDANIVILVIIILITNNNSSSSNSNINNNSSSNS